MKDSRAREKAEELFKPLPRILEYEIGSISFVPATGVEKRCFTLSVSVLADRLRALMQDSTRLSCRLCQKFGHDLKEIFTPLLSGSDLMRAYVRAIGPSTDPTAREMYFLKLGISDGNGRQMIGEAFAPKNLLANCRGLVIREGPYN